ncbi:MAG: hypothetical protein C0506_05040 [Anaerolinea sp.]|nr:hypothetical protein [Anaerolinea sp.]
MNDEELMARIEARPGVLDGKPVIRGTRLSVEYVVNLLAHGETPGAIVQEYEGLTDDDIRACLLFAKRAMEDLSFVPLMAN